MKKKIAIVDTETTGLTLPSVSDLDKQPRIIELGVLIVNYNSNDVWSADIEEHDWLIDPGNLPLPAVITKITGITSDSLVGQPTFAQLINDIKIVFSGTDILIAHNAPFDTSLLKFDLERCGCLDFPWPETIVCTAQEYTPVLGYRPTEKALYKHVIGKELAQTHRALDDVRALYEILVKDNFFDNL